ncbi:MAG: cytochrome c biogenesis CcdA family protein [Bosea sp. (in: a-proteobacteria)]
MGFDISMAGAFAAGLLSFLSPCVLPLVPPYLCYLAGISLAELKGGTEQAPARFNGRVVLSSFAFVLGFTTVFVALGASASLLGQVVTQYFDLLAKLAGGVIIVLGLHFLGVFRIGLLYREARFQTQSKPASLVGAYLVGLAFAFGWTPCVGPVLATILIVAGAEGTASRGMLLLAVYSLGIGLPFMLAAMFFGAFLRLMVRLRVHMGMVEKVMGAALVVTGLLFISGAMPVFAGWLLQTFPGFAKIG